MGISVFPRLPGVVPAKPYSWDLSAADCMITSNLFALPHSLICKIVGFASLAYVKGKKMRISATAAGQRGVLWS